MPEGDISLGKRPKPGPRKQPREIWTGGVPAESTVQTTSRPRIQGIDAARGFAVFGMIGVHTLPAWDSSTQTVTVAYQLLAGHAAALFATLAGVSLAIITGRHMVHTGRRMLRDHCNVFFRALIVIAIGTTLNFLPLTVYNILPYYGFFFLFAIPFLRLRARSLFVWSVGMAVAGPLLRYISLSLGTYPDRPESVLEVQSSVNIIDAAVDPITFVLTMVFTGVYPAITWIAFILLGMALGRLDLTKLEIQIKLAVYSALTVVCTALLSDLLLKTFRGFDRIVVATPEYTPNEVMDALVLGGEVPSTTLWWQVAAGPHLNTIASVVFSGGLAALALAFFLLAGRVMPKLLVPFQCAGSITFTIYTLHLIFLAYVNVAAYPISWCLAQIAFAMTFGVFWRAAVGQGPLERGQSELAKYLSRAVVPEKQPTEPQQFEVRQDVRPQVPPQQHPQAAEPATPFDVVLPTQHAAEKQHYPSRFEQARSRHQHSNLPPREQQWPPPGSQPKPSGRHERARHSR